MRYLLIKNKKLYNLFYNLELKKLKYKFIFNNTYLPGFVRQYALMSYNRIYKISCSSIKQRCFYTNNSRSVLNYFKISRIKLRLLVSNNYLNGIKKINY